MHDSRRHSEATAVATVAEPENPSIDPPVAQPQTIWGMSIDDLHEAYWRARGVQCVRPGQEEPVDKGADFYILLDTNALVLFDLSSIVDHLIWRAARLTRLRLKHPTSVGEAYHESVETDDNGYVRQIGRRYDAVRTHRSVNITSKVRLASRWRDAPDMRAARHAVREALAPGDFDRQQLNGVWFDANDPAEAGGFLEQLVDRWSDPGRAIEGIVQSRKGIWHPISESLPEGVSLVGPLWLGHGCTDMSETCVIGPTWKADRRGGEQTASSSVRIRDIDDIELAMEAREAQAGRQQSWYPMCKRAFDIACSASLLVVLSPLFAVITLAIFLTDGRPVIYKHQRQTRGGRNFYCLKFRTMYRHADQMLQELGEQNVCDGPQVFIENDPRVTPIGHWLRRLQMDELPQLWHVLRGDMSIVGPRPSPNRENQYCPSWREIRLSVRPGITGLWQLNRTRLPGRDFQEWIRYDIEYVRTASFWLDLKICFQTMMMVIFGRKNT